MEIKIQIAPASTINAIPIIAGKIQRNCGSDSDLPAVAHAPTAVPTQYRRLGRQESND
jgi:hypothetical protein